MEEVKVYRTCYCCGEQITSDSKGVKVLRTSDNTLLDLCNNCYGIQQKGYVGVCCFCGQPLKQRLYADDFGLHKESLGRLSCTECNELVVQTNRLLSMYVHKGRNPENIKAAIKNLEEFLEKDKEKDSGLRWSNTTNILFKQN